MRFSLNGIGRPNGLRRRAVDDCIRTGNQDDGHKPEMGMKNVNLSLNTRQQRLNVRSWRTS